MMVIYLFGISIVGREEAIALAENCGALATTDGVHFPASVIVVHDVGESPAYTWHPLNQSFPEVVEGYGYLHDLVS